MKKFPKEFLVLGLESSCDETAVGLVRRRADGSGEILANIIRSQEALHAPYGGVVPELAARAHISCMDHLISCALTESGIKLDEIDGIAATAGPGLIGGVIVGLVTAKALAAVHDLPFLAINHLEAHALSARLSDQIDYPFLLLLISGGHTSLISVMGLAHYHQWGCTRDDAVGEAFDKTARLLGLGWPGGPYVERAAQKGDQTKFILPRPCFGQAHCDFSFAGLKTALRRIVEKEIVEKEIVEKEDVEKENFAATTVRDLAASFQCAAADCLTDRTAQAMRHHEQIISSQTKKIIVAAGGVAANQMIRARLKNLAEQQGYRFIAPPPDLCTDNGAMIAWAGAEHLAAGRRDHLTASPRARWPLSEKK